MKIAVLGGTGGSGKQVILEALERGWQVTALLRNPDGLEVRDDNLQVAKVDIFNPKDLSGHFKDCDAVISCLGGNASLFGWTPSSLHINSTKSIVTAMKTSSTKRLIVMSSWGTTPTQGEPGIIKYIARPILIGHLLRDMAEMEKYLEKECSSTCIKYTSVRPPALADTPSLGKEIVAENWRQYLTDVDIQISRRDVAKFLLNSITDSSFFNVCVAIGTKK